jgi:hypothetical protein
MGMKKIVLLLLLVLSALQAKAQDPDPRLFSEWYILEYIEDGVSYVSPDNYPIEIFDDGDQDCAYFFHFPNPWHSSGGCIDSITEAQFVVHSLGILTEGEICQGGDTGCWEFFEKYRPLFADAELSGNPLSYEIEEAQNKRTLTLTNLAGDQAIYSNQYLAINDYARPKAVVYPNPVSELLVIESNYQVKKATIYTINGKTVLETFSSEIDFSHLPNGAYFLEIANEHGKEIHKIIKK